MIRAPPFKLAPTAWFVDVLVPVEVFELTIPAPLVAPPPAAVAVPTILDPVCAVAAVIEVEAAEAPKPVSVAPVAAVLAAALPPAVIIAALFEATALALAGGVEEGENLLGVRDALCAVYARSREDGLVR
jgi:hypothetical protein